MEKKKAFGMSCPQKAKLYHIADFAWIRLE